MLCCRVLGPVNNMRNNNFASVSNLSEYMNLNKPSFWSFQLTGWGTFWLANNFFRGMDDSLTLKEVVLTTLFTCTGIFLTVIMRKVFLSRFIQTPEVKYMFLRCLAVSLVATGLLTGASACYALVYEFVVSRKMVNLDIDFFLMNSYGSIILLFIWSLLYFLLRYIRQYKVSELELIRLSESLKDAQLNTLKGQINPHFMFNSLNNLRALMLEDVAAAREGISNLAEFLRYSLTSDHKDKVSLAEELAVVNEFVALAKIQYENKLTFKLDIDEMCNPCLIPVMALQMMTENAIKHGIAEQVQGGILQISAKVSAEQLVLQVSNPGLLTDIRFETHAHESYAKKQHSTGLGLSNIRQRLALLYGASAEFSLQQQNNQVLAKLVLPLEYKC
ncbi:MAG: two-component system LytT family sensor kinase [Cocleimonas sp.]|jgi:two-component system LytT family sensor kinase